MTFTRNACDLGADIIALAEVGIREVRAMRGFRHAGEVHQHVQRPEADRSRHSLGKFSARYGEESGLVGLDVEAHCYTSGTRIRKCRHSFWLTWPDLRLYSYMVMSCTCPKAPANHKNKPTAKGSSSGRG